MIAECVFSQKGKQSHSKTNDGVRKAIFLDYSPNPLSNAARHSNSLIRSFKTEKFRIVNQLLPRYKESVIAQIVET